MKPEGGPVRGLLRRRVDSGKTRTNTKCAGQQLLHIFPHSSDKKSKNRCDWAVLLNWLSQFATADQLNRKINNTKHYLNSQNSLYCQESSNGKPILL
jgi:hypothetical protein